MTRHEHSVAIRIGLPENLVLVGVHEAVHHFLGERLLVEVLGNGFQPLADALDSVADLAGNELEVGQLGTGRGEFADPAEGRVRQAVLGPHQIKQIQIKTPLTSGHQILVGPLLQ